VRTARAAEYPGEISITRLIPIFSRTKVAGFAVVAVISAHNVFLLTRSILG
jgi:hypothetical protein